MARSAPLKPSRKPSQERGRLQAVQTTGGAQAVGAYLTVKISYGPEHEASHAWQDSSVGSGLVVDLIATSGGAAVDTRGPCLLARFPAVQSAALAARRLQWASQGFTDTSDHPVQLCILLQSGEESAGEIDEQYVWQVFEQASPGEILLSGAAAKALEPVPAFVLESSTQENLRGLKWRASEEETTRQADESAIARFIALYNRSEITSEAGEGSASAAGVDQGRESAGASIASGVRPPAPNRKMISIVAGIAAAAILAVGAVLILGHKTADVPQAVADVTKAPEASTAGSSTLPPQAGTEATQTSANPNLAAAETTTQKPTEPTKKGKKDKLSQTQTATPDADVQKAPVVAEVKKPEQPRGDCEYTSDQIPGLLARAENSRVRRQYPDAKRKFAEVLACEPSNSKAKEGLELVKQAMATDE